MGTPQRGLQGVIAGIGHVLQGKNFPKARVGTRERIDIRDVRRSTRRLQIYVRWILRRHDRSTLQQERNGTVSGMLSLIARGRNRAVGQCQRLVWTERILAGRQRRQLVELALDGQVRSLASYISDIDYKVAGKLPLDAETPLLSVGPDCLGRNSCDVQRIERAGGWGRMRWVQRASAVRRINCWPVTHIANAWIIKRKGLRHAQDQRRTCLERTGVGFVARPVLEKDAVASPN